MKHIFASRIAHSLWRHWRWSFAWQHRICVIVLNLAKNINLPISSCEFPRKPTCGDLVEQAFEVRIVWFFCAKHGSASLHARRACLQYPTSPAAPSVKFFFFFFTWTTCTRKSTLLLLQTLPQSQCLPAAQAADMTAQCWGLDSATILWSSV